MRKKGPDESRRHLVRGGLSALAAGLLLKLVGTDSVTVQRVYAADGSTLIIGQANTGSSTTTLSSPVAGGPTAFFDSAGTGDAQAIQGRITGTSGRAFVGFAQAASGSTIALDGVNNSPAGIGLRGANTATTGDAIGVQGQTSSSTGAILVGKGVGGVERVRIQESGTLTQSRTAFGLVKAAALVRGKTATPTIERAFNTLGTTTIARSAGTVLNDGQYDVGFGFQVDDRLVLTQVIVNPITDIGVPSTNIGTSFPSPNAAKVSIVDSMTGGNTDADFYIVVL